VHPGAFVRVAARVGNAAFKVLVGKTPPGWLPCWQADSKKSNNNKDIKALRNITFSMHNKGFPILPVKT